MSEQEPDYRKLWNAPPAVGQAAMNRLQEMILDTLWFHCSIDVSYMSNREWDEFIGEILAISEGRPRYTHVLQVWDKAAQ